MFNSSHHFLVSDKLTPESVQILNYQSLQLWEELSLRILKLAVERCEMDEGKAEAVHTFRFGVYQNDE